MSKVIEIRQRGDGLVDIVAQEGDTFTIYMGCKMAEQTPAPPVQAAPFTLTINQPQF